MVRLSASCTLYQTAHTDKRLKHTHKNKQIIYHGLEKHYEIIQLSSLLFFVQIEHFRLKESSVQAIYINSKNKTISKQVMYTKKHSRQAQTHSIMFANRKCQCVHIGQLNVIV